MSEVLSGKKLRFVIYARKSTDDPGRQPRSIEDQIAECRELAEREGLLIVGNPLIETKSAKKPGNRPIFTQMLRDLKKGLYDGILSWNPDRLARNMREGGEIIDMIDEDQIKDLKFVTHHFTKDANGKMLLGLAFVLSKQYSDNLSQNVRRGVDRRLSEGKSGAPKHGYIKDGSGLYIPDGDNFEVIKKAWDLRLSGSSYVEIVGFLNKSGYARHTKSGKKVKIAKQTLSDLFKDQFYFGILTQKGRDIDLRDIYNFQPMITEDTYNQVQKLSYRKIFREKKTSSSFYPLKRLVVCFYCKNNMYIGPSTGRKERYLNARCGNQACERYGKSIRMIKVFEFIYSFLSDGLNFTEKDYSKYYSSLSELAEEQRQKLSLEIHSKQGYLKTIINDLEDRSNGLLKINSNSEAFKVVNSQINKLGEDRDKLTGEIEVLKEKITQPEVEQVSLEDFLNLSKNTAVIVKSANAVVKDLICRKIFLNLVVDHEKVLSYQLKEPFATLLKHRQLSSSRGERT